MAIALSGAGYAAMHDADLSLVDATDQRIWDEAISRSAVLVTKDRDFTLLRAAKSEGPVILWIRVGNTGNRRLIARVLRSLPSIIAAVERGETVIELVGL